MYGNKEINTYRGRLKIGEEKLTMSTEKLTVFTERVNGYKEICRKIKIV
jgi:hypothetical protein